MTKSNKKKMTQMLIAPEASKSRLIRSLTQDQPFLRMRAPTHRPADRFRVEQRSRCQRRH